MVRTDICGRFCRLLAYAASTVLTISLLSTTLYGADYPVIFTSDDELTRLGIGGLEFPNKCYAVTNTTVGSISNEFFARFKSRGFTVESVCLGLLSETRYDPETGRRLPTYIFVNMENLAFELREDPARKDPAFGYASTSNETPLDLPNCFKNGTPYKDCVFRFGRKTGKALTAAETATYAELGAALDKWTRAMIASGNYPADKFEDCDGRRPCEELGFKLKSGYYLSDDYSRPMLPNDVVFSGIRPSDWERLSRYSSASFWVRSSNLPRGYGYSLDVEEGLDSGVSADSVKAAMDNLSKPQISVEELRRRLNAR